MAGPRGRPGQCFEALPARCFPLGPAHSAQGLAHVLASSCCFLGLSAAATVAVLLGVRWHLAVALMCAPLTSGAEHLCMCPLAICMSSLEKPVRVLMAVTSMKKTTFPDPVYHFQDSSP